MAALAAINGRSGAAKGGRPALVRGFAGGDLDEDAPRDLELLLLVVLLVVHERVPLRAGNSAGVPEIAQECRK
eukprot:677525-Rhodomonas_salina.1